jgi:WD40 repeat protein
MLPVVSLVRRLALALLPGLLLLVVTALTAREPSVAEVKAEIALKRLSARPRGSSADQAKLRREIVALRLTCPGTPVALKAADLLSRLPSPLDRLERKNIPTLERFAWQPKELVGVLGEHRGRHGASVSCLAYSPDGKLIASGGGGLLRLWNPATMRLEGTGGHGYGISTVAFSRNSKMVAAGGVGGYLSVWDVVKGGPPRVRFTTTAGSVHVYSLAFHPNNKWLVAGSYDNSVRIFDVSGKAVKRVLENTSAHKQAVTAVACSPDGKLLATGSTDQTVRVWNVLTSDIKERSLMQDLPKGVTSLAFSPGGKSLASGCADGSVLLWRMPSGERPRSFLTSKSIGGAVTSLCFSRSGGTLATTQGDATVREWTITRAGLKARARVDGHAGVATGAVYSPDMKLLASGGTDWMVRTWSQRGKKVKERFEPWSHLSHVYSIAFAPDSARLVSGSEDRVVRFWDLDRPAPRTRSYLKGDSVPVYAVAYSPDGKLFAAAGASTAVLQWNTTGGKAEKKASCTGHPGYVTGLVYSPDGKRLLTSSEKELILWDAVKGQEVRRFPAHQTRITSLAYSADGKWALSGSGNYLYKDGKIVYKKSGHPVYTDCVLRLWDVEKGDEVKAVKDSETPFYSAHFSVDGRHLWAGPYEARMRRWLVKDRGLEEKPSWKGGWGYVHRFVPTPDGKNLVTSGLDGKIILWDLATGKRLKEWVMQETVGGLAVSGDSRHLGIALGTGVIYVLRLRGTEGGKK